MPSLWSLYSPLVTTDQEHWACGQTICSVVIWILVVLIKIRVIVQNVCKFIILMEPMHWKSRRSFVLFGYQFPNMRKNKNINMKAPVCFQFLTPREPEITCITYIFIVSGLHLTIDILTLFFWRQQKKKICQWQQPYCAMNIWNSKKVINRAKHYIKCAFDFLFFILVTGTGEKWVLFHRVSSHI